MIEPTSPLPDTNQNGEENKNILPEIAEYSIDQFLLNALTNPRDRLFILKLDKDIEKFIKDPKRAKLEFPAMSSYHRLIIHRAAQYFKVDHIVVDVENGKRAVVLIKSPNSRIPILRFSDLVEQQEEPTSSQKNVKIMKRQSPPSPLSHPILQEEFHKAANDDVKSMEKSKSAPTVESISKPNPPVQPIKLVSKSTAPLASHETPSAVPQITIMKKVDRTYEQREEEYAKARARIFGSETNPKPEATSSDEDSNASSDRLDSPRNPSSGTTSPTNPSASLSPEIDRKSPKESKKGGDDIPNVSKSTRLNTGGISGHRSSNGNAPKSKMTPPTDHVAPIPAPVIYQNGAPMPWMWGHGNPPPVNSNFVPQQQQQQQDLEHQSNGIPSQQNHYPADYDYQNPSWDYVYAPVYVQPLPPNPNPNLNDKQNNSNNNRNKPPRLQKQSSSNSGNTNGNPPVFSPPRNPSGVPPVPMAPMGMPGPYPPPNGEEMPPGNYWSPPFYPGPQFQMGFIYSEMGMPTYPYYNGMDYERRPPKSTELFDPNAPSLGKPQRHSGGLLEREMRKLNVNFPRSPSYESFFGFALANGPRGQRNPNVPPEARTQSELDRPVPVAPLPMDHILEVCGGTAEGDTFLNTVKQSGGVIKSLDDKTTIAVFPNAYFAKQALHTIRPHANMSVRVWKAPVVATPNPGTNISEGMPQPTGNKDNPPPQ